MIQPKRRVVSTEQESCNFPGESLANVRKEIDRLIGMYGPDATIDWYEPQYEDSRYLYVFTSVPESDEVYAQRVAQEAQWANAAEVRERAEFERLQKKFATKG